jgi:hypothetical protein
MSNRRFGWVKGLLAVAMVALVAERALAVFYPLGPSEDEWGLKYNVEVEDAGGDMVTVKLTLLDEGRLKPVHSARLGVLIKERSNSQSKTYSIVGRLDLKPTADGKRVGTIKLRKDQVALGSLELITQHVDGRFQARGAATYDIPLAKHMNGTDSPAVASPPQAKSGNVRK